MPFYLDHFGVDVSMEVHDVVYQLLKVYMFDLYFDKKNLRIMSNCFFICIK
jgi:hypothetical protein